MLLFVFIISYIYFLYLGNHSVTQYPNVVHGHVTNYPQSGLVSSVAAAVNDPDWLQNTFIPAVQKRGAAIIKARKLSSAASAANAAADHMRDWFLGTAPVLFHPPF